MAGVACQRQVFKSQTLVGISFIPSGCHVGNFSNIPTQNHKNKVLFLDLGDYMEELCSVNDIPEGGSKIVDLGDKEIALFKIDGEVFAINNACPHMQASLADGMLEGNAIVCPLHRWKFNVTNGQSEFPPGQQVQCFNVEVQGDIVCLVE